MTGRKQTDTLLLTSPQNPLLKDVRRAAANGTLTGKGCVVAEGFHLLEEALRCDRRVHCVLAASSVRETVIGHVKGLSLTRVYAVADKLFAQVASTENSQGVISLVKPPQWSMDQLFRGQSLVVILDGIQDPGNAGAIVRAAEAFGATGCLFLKGTVSPHNPKTLRAAAGSLFRLPTISSVDVELARAAVGQHRLDLYAATPDGNKALRDADLRRRFALVVGSEGRGVSAGLRSGAFDLRIPTLSVESLNAAVAAGVILYEARRQRMPR